MISSRMLRDTVAGFDTMPMTTVERIASLATDRRYAPNRVLYRAGDAADGLYLVLSGRVRVSRQTGSRSRVLHDEGPGVLARAEASPAPEFTLGVSQSALADELDTAREVLVRALGALIDARAIRRTGRSRFAVVRPAVLRAMAGR